MFEARVLVIADDLTGAADAGVHFARQGDPALLMIRPGSVAFGREMYSTLVINTNTRDMPEAEALQQLSMLMAQIPQEGSLYKKIDSTLRGHLVKELDLIMEATGRNKAIVTPAYPTLGRFLRKGRVFIGENPLSDTEIWKDRSSPWTDDLLQLLKHGLHRPVLHVDTSMYSSDADRLLNEIDRLQEGILVVDVTDEREMLVVGQAVADYRGSLIACGSGGLAEALGIANGANSVGASDALVPGCSNVLIIAGTTREATRLQLEQVLRMEGATQIGLATKPTGGLTALNLERMSIGEHQVRTYVLASGHLDVQAPVAESLVRSLAEIAASLQEQLRIDGMIITGGATTDAVCEAMSIDALKIHHEIIPGIPLCEAASGPNRGLWLVTKAGGFGDEHALKTVLHYLQASSYTG